MLLKTLPLILVPSLYQEAATHSASLIHLRCVCLHSNLRKLFIKYSCPDQRWKKKKVVTSECYLCVLLFVFILIAYRFPIGLVPPLEELKYMYTLFFPARFAYSSENGLRTWSCHLHDQHHTCSEAKVIFILALHNQSTIIRLFYNATYPKHTWNQRLYSILSLMEPSEYMLIPNKKYIRVTTWTVTAGSNKGKTK